MSRPDAAPTGVQAASEHWLHRPEGGGWFALWLIRSIGLYCGRRCARLLLYPITLYFYFRRGPERRAARDYFRRLDGRAGSAWQVMRLIHAFASTILDRVFLLARGVKGFNISHQGADDLHARVAAGHGVLLVGAHIGSFDVLRVLAAEQPEFQLKLVMDKSKTPAMTRLLEALAPDLAACIIDTARGGTDMVLAMAEALQAGAMVTLLGDRGRPGEPMRDAPFLGSDAPFPTAPWLIAALLKVPVVLCLGLYRGGNRYELVFECLAEQVELRRGNREAALDRYIHHYASRLEHHVRQAPYNWFNFYDFWQSQAVADVAQGINDDLRDARAS